MIEKVDRVLAKLDEIAATLRDCRMDPASIIIHQWIALFFLPAAAFIGGMVWLWYR